MCVLVVYAAISDFGYNNWEFSFPAAAIELSRGASGPAVETYLADQPTPPLYVLLAAGLLRLTRLPPDFWVVRLPSAVSVGVVAAMCYFLARSRLHASRPRALSGAAFVALHPMFVMYGTQATANVLPLLFLSVSVIAAITLADKATWVGVVVAGAALGLAIGSKYNALYMTPLVLLLVVENVRCMYGQRRPAIGVVGVAAVVTLACLSLYRAVFGIIGARDSSRHRPNLLDLSGWLVSFSKYLAFLGLFLLPAVAWVVAMRRVRPSRIVAVALVTLIYYGTVAPLRRGEMNFGMFADLGLGEWARIAEAVGMCAAVLWLHLTIEESRSQTGRNLASGTLIYLILLSFSLPIQRHLVVVLPFAILAMLDLPSVASKSRLMKSWHRVSFVGAAVGTVAISTLAYGLLRSQGDAADRMARWLDGKGLVESTSGGLWVHAGQYRVGRVLREPRHEVVQVGRMGAVPVRTLHTEDMRLLGFLVRTYAVVPIAAADG
jgi:hypothetical protein